MFLQIQDEKRIPQDFCSDAWVLPQGSDIGKQGVPKGSKMVMWHIKLTGDDE